MDRKMSELKFGPRLVFIVGPLPCWARSRRSKSGLRERAASGSLCAALHGLSPLKTNPRSRATNYMYMLVASSRIDDAFGFGQKFKLMCCSLVAALIRMFSLVCFLRPKLFQPMVALKASDFSQYLPPAR
jgi:hypothetical protein